MSLFRKKEKERAVLCSCGSICNAESMAKAKHANKNGASIKILGSGCTKCNQLETTTKAALAQLGMDMTIDHITDFMQIASYGVMATPALVVDEKVVSHGNILKVDEVVKIIQEARGIEV